MWIDAEINRALESGKPAFLYFYAEGCGFCQKQKPIIEELEQKYAEVIAFIRVNGPDQPQATEEFGVTSFPAMFLISGKGADGKYIYQQFTGLTDEKTLKGALDAVVGEGATSVVLNPPPAQAEEPEQSPEAQVGAGLQGIPPGYSREIFEVKFREGTQVRLRDAELTGLTAWDEAELSSILQQYPMASFTRLFSLPEEELDELRARGQHLARKMLPDLNQWFRVTLGPGADAEGFMKALKHLDGVEIVEPAPLLAPLPAFTPNFMGNQGYLNAATGGIDALYAWRVPGGNGAGVKIYDVEYSWNQTHEDLSKANGIALLLNAGDAAVDPFASNDHGTAVLGELIADFNGFGVTGISWGAGIGLAPANTANLGYNPANAIALATANALLDGDPGDVILIEQQTDVCGLPAGSYGPLEWIGSVFTAIQTAVANGIVVVEAAGNGGVDLDQAACGTYFQRATQDSGATIVGAGQPPASGNDRQRETFSTYGSRVDVQGWGSGVVTTGYGDAAPNGYRNPDDPSNPNYWYTFTFGGTSSASPFVAGAAANLQGIAKNQQGGPLPPSTHGRCWCRLGALSWATLRSTLAHAPTCGWLLLSSW